MIVPIITVRAALEQAERLGHDRDSAVLSTAQRFCLDPETVQEIADQPSESDLAALLSCLRRVGRLYDVVVTQPRGPTSQAMHRAMLILEQRGAARRCFEHADGWVAWCAADDGEVLA